MDHLPSGSSASRGGPGDAGPNQSETNGRRTKDVDPSSVRPVSGPMSDTNANKTALNKNSNPSSENANDNLGNDFVNGGKSQTKKTTAAPADSASIKCLEADGGANTTEKAADNADATAADKVDGACLSSMALDETKKPLNEILNDAGQFSYVALCSVNLALLFEDQWNKAWKEKRVHGLVAHMKLPKKMSDTMFMLMSTQQDEEGAAIFAKGLLDDPCLPRPQLVPQDLILWSLSDGQYDARSRVLAIQVAQMMDVSEEEIQAFETSVVSSFTQQKVELSEEELKEREKRATTKKVKRFALIGAAAVGGGALIGLTGGLAAPLIASAGAALLGSGVAFLGSAAGVAVMASVFGAAGAGLTGFKMKKRVGAVEEFAFDALSDEKDLHITIAISGWLTKETLTFEDEVYNNFSVPWLTLGSSKEVYSLRWESKYLLDLGEALTLILNKMLTMAAKEALKMTVLAGLVVAFALPATAYSSLVAIDNPWSVVTNRAAEAGKQLAEVLLSRQQGKRPVTLIGFSMGARVIFFCLKELASRKGCEGILQDAVMLGAPVSSSVKHWKSFDRVVAGRIINGYCRGDWLLQFLYRAASVQMINIAGLGPVQWENRRMVNVDLTDIVNGHFDYAEKMDDILKAIGIRTNASPLRQSLAKLTPGQLGGQVPEAACGSNEATAKVSVIDASDLILPTSNDPNPEAKLTSVHRGVRELDLTGQSEMKPDQTLPDKEAADEGSAVEMLEGMTP